MDTSTPGSPNAPSPDGTDALNLKQVARLLDVHYMTAYRYVRQGRLPATWVDNGWQVHRDDLETFRTGPAPTDQSSGTVDWAARLAPRALRRPSLERES